MKVEPRNRHLLVKVVEAIEAQPSILVPDDYVTAKAHELAKVLASSSDCYACYEVGQHVIVEGHMIKDVCVLGQNHQLVSEIYVLAVVTGVKL